MLSVGQRKFLESLLETKIRVLYGTEITPEIKELVAAGYVKEASVNISECGYMITEEGRNVLK